MSSLSRSRAPLRARHREVLVLAAQGFTQEESAQRLYLSRHTVEAHLSEARERLDALNTAHAVALAIATGQLEVSA